jgi:hypothetical protein
MQRGAMPQLKEDLASKYPPDGVRTQAHTIFEPEQSTLNLDVEFVVSAFIALAQDPKTA